MYAWLFARNHGGKFILRIEDTDTARNDKESERDIYDALQWLGIDHDELYIQSQNLARHQEILKTLIDTDKAYISREEAKDGSGVMKDIIRFRNPGKSVTFNDLVRGPITTDTADLGDFVIARNINEPLYHLAAVMTVEQINATKDAIMEVILFLVCVGGIGFLWLASMGVFDKDN
jgi:glutamyl/glutaminyl-tRNA synthetase